MSEPRSGRLTTAQIAAGRIVRRELHRARFLYDGVPTDVADAALADADAAARRLGEGMIRVLLYREAGGWRPKIDAGPARRRPFAAGDAPLSLILRPDPREGEALLTKSLDRRALVAVEDEAARLGADGALLEGPDGLREGTWFSFVVRLEGAWCAPPIGEGVLFSTTRAAFADALARRGERLRAMRLSRADLRRAEGALVLSSLLGAAPVARVEDETIPVLSPEQSFLLLTSSP